MVKRGRKKVWDWGDGGSRVREVFETKAAELFDDDGRDSKGRQAGAWPDGRAGLEDGRFVIPEWSDLRKWGPRDLPTRPFDTWSLTDAIRGAVWAGLQRTPSRQRMQTADRLRAYIDLFDKCVEVREELLACLAEGAENDGTAGPHELDDPDFAALLRGVDSAIAGLVRLMSTGRVPKPTEEERADTVAPHFAEVRMEGKQFFYLVPRNLAAAMLQDWGLEANLVAALFSVLKIDRSSIESVCETVRKAKNLLWVEMGKQSLGLQSALGLPQPQAFVGGLDEATQCLELRAEIARHVDDIVRIEQFDNLDSGQKKWLRVISTDTDVALQFTAAYFGIYYRVPLSLHDLQYAGLRSDGDGKEQRRTPRNADLVGEVVVRRARTQHAHVKDKDGVALLRVVHELWGELVALRMAVGLLRIIDIWRRVGRDRSGPSASTE